MHESELFCYGAPMKLSGFKKYSNEGRNIKFVHPPNYVAQPGTPGLANLPGHPTDPHDTPNSVDLCISFVYWQYSSIRACSHVPICTLTLLLVHYMPRTKNCKQTKRQATRLLSIPCESFCGCGIFYSLLSDSNMSKMPPIRLLDNWDSGYLGEQTCTKKYSNNQTTTKFNDKIHGLCYQLSTNLRYVYLSLASLDTSVLETLGETE